MSHDDLVYQARVNNRFLAVENRVTELEGVIADSKETRSDHHVGALRLVLRQIALTLPEKFRPPEEDWEKLGALSKAINNFMEQRIKQLEEVVGENRELDEALAEALEENAKLKSKMSEVAEMYSQDSVKDALRIKELEEQRIKQLPDKTPANDEFAEVFAGVDLSLELFTMLAALVRYGTMTMTEAEDTLMEAEDQNKLVLAMSYDTLPVEARESAISLAKTGPIFPTQPCSDTESSGCPSIVVPGIFKILLRHGWIDETLLWGYGDSPVFDLWPLAKEFLARRI
jgi:regulator of replication initiation timing